MTESQSNIISPLASRYVEGLGVRSGKLKRRIVDPLGVIVHTTGEGPFRRWSQAPKKHESPHAAAVWIYQNAMNESGHFVVSGDDGEIVQVVPENYVAQHVGVSRSNLYPLADWAKKYDCEWWTRAFSDLDSPLHLDVWRGGSCNARTFGIEVSPPMRGPRHAWSDATWDALVRLIADLWSRHPTLRQDRRGVLSHSEAHPISRTAKGKPWDPGADQWDPVRLMTSLAKLRGR